MPHLRSTVLHIHSPHIRKPRQTDEKASRWHDIGLSKIECFYFLQDIQKARKPVLKKEPISDIGK